MKLKPTVTDEYNRHGYIVYWQGEPVYEAGNHKHDSTQPATIGTPEALSLREIRRNCQIAVADYAQENDAWIGEIERIQDEEA